jgi:Short C-terminal domain
MPLRRGPGLVRTVGRTAVIAGTATAVSGRVANRQAQRNAPEEPQAQYVEAPPAAAPADDQMEQLEKLGDLHAKGILTDEEFAAKKAQILGI